jgi:antitoxin component of MazEF toxin-antitoxin module
MQPAFRPKEEVNNGDFHLSDISTIFDGSLDGLPDFGNIPSPLRPPSNPGHGHHRSISSESASSLVQRTHPSRTHPSLGNYRGGQSPNSLVAHLAPPNHRPTPSVAMSRRDIPRHSLTSSTRRRSAGSDDEGLSSEGPEPPGADATEQEKIEYKRRMNTLAARRSRRRRLAQFHQLEEDVARLNREKDIWKERALMMERMLSTHGLPCPNFER